MYIDVDSFDKFINKLGVEWYSPGGFASILKIPRTTVYSWIRSNRIDAVRYKNEVDKGNYIGIHSSFLDIEKKRQSLDKKANKAKANIRDK